MNSQEWLEQRTNAELLDLLALLDGSPEKHDSGPWVGHATQRWKRHRAKVSSVIGKRAIRQMNFMDRLDGKEATDD